MLATPTEAQIASALDVVRDPARYADQPGLRAFAWAALKAQRGQQVNQSILCQMQRAQQIAARPRPVAVQHIAIGGF